jgi:hypothetical protein
MVGSEESRNPIGVHEGVGGGRIEEGVKRLK